MIFSALIENVVNNRAEGDVGQHDAWQYNCLQQHINIINACSNGKEANEYANYKQFNEDHAAVDY